MPFVKHPQTTELGATQTWCVNRPTKLIINGYVPPECIPPFPASRWHLKNRCFAQAMAVSPTHSKMKRAKTMVSTLAPVALTLGVSRGTSPDKNQRTGGPPWPWKPPTSPIGSHQITRTEPSNHILLGVRRDLLRRRSVKPRCWLMGIAQDIYSIYSTGLSPFNYVLNHIRSTYAISIGSISSKISPHSG